MKKIIICAVIAISIFSLEAQTYKGIFDPGTGEDYTDFNGTRQNGFTWPLQNQVNDAYAMFNSVQNQVVIGHSLGGMRGLGYANKMSSAGRLPYIKGIIMTGGPVRGYTPLANGVDALGGRIKDTVKKMMKGLESCTTSPGIITDIGLFNQAALLFEVEAVCRPLTAEFMNTKLMGTATLGDVARAFVSGRLGYLTDGLLGPQVIKDFTPGEAFVRDNLDPVKTLVTAGHYENVYVGGEVGYVAVWVDPVYSYTPRIPVNADFCIGYIYGTKGDPLADIPLFIDDFKPDEVRAYFTIFKSHFQNSQVMNASFAVGNSVIAALVPFPFNINYLVLAISQTTASANAKTAKDICADYKGYYNKTILNTTKGSDGFIPVDAVTRPFSETGGKAYAYTGASNNIPDYMYYGDWSHQGMLDEDAIWGTEGSWANPQHGGRIYTWLSAKNYQSAVDNRKYMDVNKTTRGQW